MKTEPFDSSRSRALPEVCRLGAGALVPGLDMALPTLSKGTRAEIVVPPHRGYGQRGFPPIVPPEAVLIYDLELLAIE